MASVTLKNLIKRYGKVTAVNEVSLEIRDGEFIILLGPSGCGKSTLLYSIAGLEDISGGEIYIGERLMNRVPPKARNIAMVFQDYALYPHMNVYENMAFGLKLRKASREEIDRRVHEAAGLLGIEHLLQRRPRELSGGQRQRVALGRALVREPDVFLMDEPLSNLDAILRVQMRAEISKLHNRLKTTFIYVTHDQVEAMTMGDRIVILRDGVIQQVGTPQEVYTQPANIFVAGFIGTPSMNFISGTLARRDGALSFDGGSFRVPLPPQSAAALATHEGRAVIAGVRPSAVQVLRGAEAEAMRAERVDGSHASAAPKEGYSVREGRNEELTQRGAAPQSNGGSGGAPSQGSAPLKQGASPKESGAAPQQGTMAPQQKENKHNDENARARVTALPEGIVAARVDVVEPMGDVAYIFADAGGQAFTVRVDPLSIPALGQVVPLRLDGAALHLFDAETQQSLAAPVRSEAEAVTA